MSTRLDCLLTRDAPTAAARCRLAFATAWITLLALLPTMAGVAPARAEDETAAQRAPASVEEIAERARGSVVVVTHADRDGQMQALGTGFFVSAEGLVATNLHVVGEGRSVAVQLADGSQLPVTAVHATDRTMDLAVLQVDPGAHRPSPLELGERDELRVGASLVVMGNPRGLRHSVVSGVLSAFREIEGRQMLQLAVPIEAGNSGGPVLDARGRVQGVMTMKSAVTDNLGFAVEAAALRRLLDDPNPVPIDRWQRIGQLDPRRWTTLFGAQWRQRGGQIAVTGAGSGFGGRALCLWNEPQPELPFELAVRVRLDDESGAAGLVFHSDGDERHYGFYPSGGRMRLVRFEGPTVFSWNILAERATPHYRAGEWNQLRVRVERDEIRGYVNDELVIRLDERHGAAEDASLRVGLAKFRDTQAQFAQFQVGEQLSAARVAEPEREAILEAIAALDSSPVIGAGLDPLVERGRAGVEVLERRAEELEREAERLRTLAANVHLRQVARRLNELLDDESADDRLLHAALLVSQLDNRELDVPSYLDAVAGLVEDLDVDRDADWQARLAALDELLFGQLGFHGSRWDYYHRANSYMDRVLDDREGLPLTLSILYAHLARQLGLDAHGVGLPGHFIVRVRAPEGDDGDDVLVDVFDGGERLTRADVLGRLRRAGASLLVDRHLQPASDREVVVRMLRNLVNAAQRDGDRGSSLRYLEAMLFVDPTLVRERGQRALLRVEAGEFAAAQADLDWLLEHEPDEVDLGAIRRLQDFLSRQNPADDARGR